MRWMKSTYFWCQSAANPRSAQVRPPEIISLIDPRIVIPMHYQFDGIRSDLDTLDRFLREMGAAGAQSVARLVVSHSNLPWKTLR